jgi:hypothetical protein
LAGFDPVAPPRNYSAAHENKPDGLVSLSTGRHAPRPPPVPSPRPFSSLVRFLILSSSSPSSSPSASRGTIRPAPLRVIRSFRPHLHSSTSFFTSLYFHHFRFHPGALFRASDQTNTAFGPLARFVVWSRLVSSSRQPRPPWSGVWRLALALAFGASSSPVI